MRISTSQIYDSGIRGMQRGQSALYKTQNQIAANRRVLTPADDPVASAQAVVVAQTEAINTQYQTNQTSAANQLAVVDNQLSSVTNVLQKVRDSLVKAGNIATMSTSDRLSVVTDLQGNLSELIGIANSTDAVGDYMFSGYQGNTVPFAVDATQNAVPPATATPIGYYGDDGERLLQVSATRQMAVNVSGYDVFMDARNGNGTFVAQTGGNTTSGGNNLGSATIDTGSVLDPKKWTNAVNDTTTGLPLTIAFSTNATSGALEYTITDGKGNSTAAQAYTAGQAIPLKVNGVDFGSQVVVSGTPSATTTGGDSFEITASTTQSAFQTIQNAIAILGTTIDTSNYTATQMANDLALQLSNVDLAMENVGQVQSVVGANMREVDNLANTSADLAVQYSATLSDLQDLDYVEAYSNYTKQQVALEAAQKSFTAISGKSLFDYI